MRSKTFAAMLAAGTTILFLTQPMFAVAQDAETERENQDAGSSTKLKRIVIDSEGAQGATADIAEQAAPVSIISAEDFQERSIGNVNDTLRSKPGVFTRQGAEQPGVVINVRGMQGMGRVNTMIDGVPQTFRNLSGHGGSFDNMAYVDPNMLAGAEITRGAVSGAQGLGTLSGAANLRTLGVDDVLLEGRDYGGLVTLKAGSNGNHFSRLTAGGWRHDIGSDGEISFMGALSGSNFGNFKNGDGIYYPYDSSQDPTSGLFKLNFKPNSDHSLLLGGIVYKNAFAVESAGYDWKIDNKTYTAQYAYRPGNDLIDLKINTYANITDIGMNGTDGVFVGRQGTNTSLGLDISNTSVVDLSADTELKLNYGAAIASDDYKGNDQRGANPDGKLLKSGAFADGTVTHGIFGLTGGLRYDAWRLNGVSEYLQPGTIGCPASSASLCAGENISRSGGEWNPRIGATLTPMDWLELYANYAYTMRPPTAAEMFYPGGHNFDGTGDPINNNPNLVPERQRGLDLGLNLRGDGLFTAEDQGYLKLGYFRNRISNYITYATDRDGKSRWINLPGTTVMQGVEIEGGYDIGRAYGSFSVTVADTRQPLGNGAGFGNDVGQLPDDFATLDAGMRFFEQKLTLGGRIRYTGNSFQAYMNAEQSLERPSYTLVDLYGSWKFHDKFSAFFTVDNLLDKGYWAANTGTSDILQTISNGRGRTIMVGATARF